MTLTIRFCPSATFTFPHICSISSISVPTTSTLLSSHISSFEHSSTDLRSFRCGYVAQRSHLSAAAINSGVENCLRGTFGCLFQVPCSRLEAFPSVFESYFTYSLKSSQLFSMKRNLYLKKLYSGGGALLLAIILYFLSMSFSCWSLWISLILSLNAWQSWLQFCQMGPKVPRRCRGHLTLRPAYR